MKKEDVKVEMLKLDSITPDPNQPRKNFNPERIADLRSSIEKYGIMNPLVVEEIARGKYMLVDGERRFRAATEIGLKEVPAIIREASDETERIIQQFHIQEQHEGWSATEKAVAVATLSERLGIAIKPLAAMLSLPHRTVKDYAAFAELLNKNEFVKQEIPVHFAPEIVGLRKFVKNRFLKELETEFTEKQEEQLEQAIVRRIKSGSIKIRRDITKLRDSVVAQPKSILKFIKNEGITVNELFLQTSAKGAFAYRNFVSNARSISHYGGQVMKIGGKNLLTDEDTAALRRARDVLDTFLTN